MWNLFEKIINALKPSRAPDQQTQDSPQPADQFESWNQDTSQQEQDQEQPVGVTQQDV
jgi:hypothetical protein